MAGSETTGSEELAAISVRVPPALVRAVADAILAQLEARDVIGRQSPDRWMTTREAASYVGRSVDAMHKLTAARQVPFSQDGPGGKCWFRKSDLDAWMQT